MVYRRKYITILLCLISLVLLLVALLFINSKNSSNAAELLSMAEKKWLKKKGTITFVSQTLYPPFEFIDRDGRRQGMCFELANWIATEFGFKARFMNTTFAKAQQAVLSGKADVLTSFFYSKQRDRTFDFTSVMWDIPAMIFVKSERPDIVGLKQLAGKKIAIQKGDYAKEFLDRKKIPYTMIACNSFAEATQLVISDKADAIIGDEQIVLHHVYSKNLLDKIKRIGSALYVGKNSMSVKENSPILLSILNKGIRLARKRGIFERINQKWLGTRYKESKSWLQRNFVNIIVLFSFLVVSIVLTIVWNIQLRHMVKRRTRQLAVSEEKYRSFFESAQDAIILHDVTGKIVDVNNTMVKMYGFKNKKELLKLNFIKDFSSDTMDLKSLKKICKKVIADLPQELEWEAKSYAMLHTFPVNISMKHVAYENEDLILTTVKDLTMQKKAEQTLIQAQRMEAVGTLAGGLAHDFNNVLGGILGPVSIIENSFKKNKPVDVEQFQRFVELIRMSSERASNIVKQLLTISKKQKLSLITVDLNQAVKQVIDLVQNSFDKAIEISVSYSEHPAQISGDPTQIEQVFLNFLINASHALTIMRGKSEKWGGIIEISIKKTCAGNSLLKQHSKCKKGYYWLVNILDAGVGMSQETSNKIFDPFFTTKEKGQGSGLGLSMAFNIIEQHGGFVDFYSELGIGTSFSLYFPILSENEEMEDQMEERLLQRGEGTILVVEDEDILREIAKEMLGACGYKTILASNGEEAVELFKEHRKEIDAVLLDMIMPKLSGLETYQIIRGIDADVKVLLASGFKQDERIQTVLNLGADGFIQKPYTLEKLAESLASIMK